MQYLGRRRLEHTGIIDWEFANIVPLRLFTPPSWASFQELELVKLSIAFFDELNAAAVKDERLKPLALQWYGSKTFPEVFDIARLIRHPTDVTTLIAAYFRIWKLGDDLEKAESGFLLVILM